MRDAPTKLAWDVLLDLAGYRGGVADRLTTALRDAIRDGRLPHGTALPPSRTLAAELNLSRSTVTRAYGQLVAECYLEARTGSATRVRWTAEPVRRPPAPRRPPAAIPYDMELGRPDLRAFPRRQWLRALGEAAQTASYAELDYPEPGGVQRLRTVLAGYLNRVRGAALEPGSVHVCFGAAHGMLRICSALRDSGHTAIAVEDPGPARLWHAARLAGLALVPVPVDGDGMVVSALADHPEVRAVCVGAAHQCPLGPALAPHRRAALLDWARRVDGLIVEDDWDAEFRYDRPAVATVQGMQPQRVALLGSVTRALGPAVGIGWLAAPPQWTVTLHDDDRLRLMPPALNQLALAAMLESGAYDRHLRASRSRFRARRGRLLRALDRIPGCTVRGADAGLHVLLELPAGCDAAAVVSAAFRQGLHVADLDNFRIRADPGAAPALVLGYGNLADAAVEDAVAVLRRTITAVRGAAAGGRTNRGATRR